MHTISRWKVNQVYLERLTALIELDEFTSQTSRLELQISEIDIPTIGHTLKRGELYVVAGPTCSGKTYLAQSIARELDHSEHQVIVDGSSVEHMPYELWRDQVIHIDRTSSFVEGTIIDNITCFQPALHKAAYSLCEAMQIKHIIDELRLGFYTELKTTNTVPLPRQVIFALTIIRALLSKKSIVIIDDLDLVYDARFAKNLITCIRPRSDAFICIFISNRLSALDHKLNLIQLPPRGQSKQSEQYNAEQISMEGSR